MNGTLMSKFNFFRKRYFESKIDNGYLLWIIERYKFYFVKRKDAKRKLMMMIMIMAMMAMIRILIMMVTMALIFLPMSI